MTEKLKNFIEAAVKNNEMLKKLKDLKNLSWEEQVEQIMSLAAGEGISLTEDDFRQCDGKELTDTELEQIAGGVKYQETKDENEKKYYKIAIDSHKEILAVNRGTDSP